MRQAIVAIIMGIVLLSCTNARVIQYNTERLDNIEEYLRENKFIKPSENVEKLKEEGFEEVSNIFIAEYDKGQLNVVTY